MKGTAASIPSKEYITSGHLGCQGCGAALAMRYVLKALGEKTIIVLPACCWSIIAGPYPYTAVKLPLIHSAFETAAVTASGIRAALDIQGDEDTTVLAWSGDGGTFDIGLQALSGAAERDENILYVCYDNEAYMNTGIQCSSATPWGAWTTTTPHAKTRFKKDIIQIMAAHRIPYAATASVAYPEDLFKKVSKARRIKGTRFIHLLSACPPGWKISAEQSIRLARLAVLTRVFPLLEVEEGTSYTVTDFGDPIPVERYLTAQGRFKNLSPHDIEQIQVTVNLQWKRLNEFTKKSARIA